MWLFLEKVCHLSGLWGFECSNQDQWLCLCLWSQMWNSQCLSSTLSACTSLCILPWWWLTKALTCNHPQLKFSLIRAVGMGSLHSNKSLTKTAVNHLQPSSPVISYYSLLYLASVGSSQVRSRVLSLLWIDFFYFIFIKCLFPAST